ncbi:hypothetical protein [Claveliimonas bilis]|nr:hypothetical protein [Claveliimonas bilis]
MAKIDTIQNGRRKRFMKKFTFPQMVVLKKSIRKNLMKKSLE